MGQYEGGYTSAVNSQSERGARDVTNQHLTQLIQQRAIEMALQNALQQRQAQARTNVGNVLPDIFGAAPQGAPFNAAGSPPMQQMPPGQPSVPMQAPGGAPPMGPPGGMSISSGQSGAASIMPEALYPGQTWPGESPLPPMRAGMSQMPPGAPDEVMAGAGTENSPSPGPSEPQAAPMPVGWTPSPSASPELGGQEAGAPSAPAGASVGAPPPMPKMPPQLLSAPVLIQALVKRGVPNDQIVDALHQMEPIINSENRFAIAQFKAENDATKAANAAYRAAIDEFRAKNQGRNVDSLVARRAAGAEQGQEKIDIARGKAAGGRPPPMFNLTAGQSPAGRAAMLSDIQNPAPDPNPVATAGAGQGAGLSQQGLDLAASQFARTGQLPSFSRDPIERRRIINRAAEMEGEAGNAPGDTVTNRMDQKAVQQSYNAITKDLTAIGPYNNMLETNGAVAKDLAAKAIASSAQLANKPINWLRQNATDNPDVAKYLAQIRIFTTEAARVLNNPRLVGQLTDTARKEMEGVINGDMPLNATVGVIDRLTQDGKIRVGSMEDQAAYLKDRLAGKKDATAPAARSTTGAPAGARTFKTEAEAAAAGLAKGTKVIVNGVPGTWQ